MLRVPGLELVATELLGLAEDIVKYAMRRETKVVHAAADAAGAFAQKTLDDLPLQARERAKQLAEGVAKKTAAGASPRNLRALGIARKYILKLCAVCLLARPELVAAPAVAGRGTTHTRTVGQV